MAGQRSEHTSMFDLHQFITGQLIEAIEAGCPPWRQPWSGGTDGVYVPLRHNDVPYQGINILVLWSAASAKGYTSSHWMTFKQAKDLGASVRKDERSTVVIYYKPRIEVDKEGKEKHSRIIKRFNVFNADQIIGLPKKYYMRTDIARSFGTQSDPQLDQFFASTGATIKTHTHPTAYYQPKKDCIYMPPVAWFVSSNDYYTTLAHELVHWTKGKHRLQREQTYSGRKGYAFEELVAEIGSCFLCASLGLTPDFSQSGAYIESWVNHMKKDKHVIFRAASEAQKAINFIFELSPLKDKTLEQKKQPSHEQQAQSETNREKALSRHKAFALHIATAVTERIEASNPIHQRDLVADITEFAVKMETVSESITAEGTKIGQKLAVDRALFDAKRTFAITLVARDPRGPIAQTFSEDVFSHAEGARRATSQHPLEFQHISIQKDYDRHIDHVVKNVLDNPPEPTETEKRVGNIIHFLTESAQDKELRQVLSDVFKSGSLTPPDHLMKERDHLLKEVAHMSDDPERRYAKSVLARIFKSFTHHEISEMTNGRHPSAHNGALVTGLGKITQQGTLGSSYYAWYDAAKKLEQTLHPSRTVSKQLSLGL